MNLESLLNKIDRDIENDTNTLKEQINEYLKESLKLVNENQQLQQQLQAYKEKEKENKFIEIAPLDLAMHFHNTYEKLAPSFGYKTREDTKQFDINSNNGQLMVAVCQTILNDILQIPNDKETEDETLDRIEILDKNINMLTRKIDIYKINYDRMLTRTEVFKLREKYQNKLNKLREKDDLEKLSEDKEEEYLIGFLDAIEKITTKEPAPRDLELNKR